MKTKKIFTIFPKKRTPKMKFRKKQTIDVDYREKSSLVPAALIKEGLDIHFKELKVADYIVKGVAIERKTVSDFITSMKNRRLLNQLQELQQYKKKLLIIEGIDEQDLYTDSGPKGITIGGELIGMHPNSVRGFLLSILLKYNVPIIFTKNTEDSARFIYLLSKKKEYEHPLQVKKKTHNKKEQLQFIIESFPGIGPKTARKLLKEFSTVSNIISAPIEKLKDCIGKKAEIIKELVDKEY